MTIIGMKDKMSGFKILIINNNLSTFIIYKSG